MSNLSLPPKPMYGQPCNGCGYCCTKEPCELAQEFLNCTVGPCIALESDGNKAICGMVRNPLGYLYKAAHPNDESVHALDAATSIDTGRALSAEIAAALGIGMGCDADDSFGSG